jgi:2-methylcitrate dehydratase
MTDGITTVAESNRFLEAAQDLPRLPAGELHRLNIASPAGALGTGKPGIL